MKHPTKHLSELNDNLRRANKILNRVPANELKTDVHELKARAYVLLVHAAFEAYFEQLGLEAVKASRKTLKNGKISFSLVALITSCVAAEVSEKGKKGVTEKLVRNLKTFSEEAGNQYFRIVEENHGIKNHNLKSLLLPIGVDPEEVDVALWNSLHEFGTLRGGLAHSFKAIANEHTPSSLRSKVNGITVAIAELDKAVCNAHSVTMPVK